jgi:hypothetical protein
MSDGLGPSRLAVRTNGSKIVHCSRARKMMRCPAISRLQAFSRGIVLLCAGLIVGGKASELIGRATDENGTALSGATVFIYTAAPKVGLSSVCASCYLDCAKTAKADADGNFRISNVASDLMFQVLVVAKDRRPTFVTSVDPEKGTFAVKLLPLALTSDKPDQLLRGRVVDSSRQPISGAVVYVQGMVDRQGGDVWGELPGVDPIAVTDEGGEFVITSATSFSQMHVKLSARGYANRIVVGLASDSVHTLVMTEGALLSGRVVFEGKPLKQVSVGLISVDRSLEKDTGEVLIATDARGDFTFSNLPPNTDYHIYGGMHSLRSYGAIPVARVRTRADHEATNVGDLQVQPGHRIVGRVVLDDGAPLLEKTRLVISREEAFDSQVIEIGPEGKFEAEGIPTERLRLSVRVKGYRVSAKNRSFDPWNPTGLVGRVDGDIAGLELLMEKNDPGRPAEAPPPSRVDRQARPENNRLAGAESKL